MLFYRSVFQALQLSWKWGERAYRSNNTSLSKIYYRIFRVIVELKKGCWCMKCCPQFPLPFESFSFDSHVPNTWIPKDVESTFKLWLYRTKLFPGFLSALPRNAMTMEIQNGNLERDTRSSKFSPWSKPSGQITGVLETLALECIQTWVKLKS